MLIVHRAERADILADALAEVLRQPPADPFAAELIAVPAKGVERWLNQRLAARLGTDLGADGVAANIEFPSPAALVERAVAAASGLDPDRDPWSAHHLVWRVLEQIDASLDQPWCAVLARHLGAGIDEWRAGRRFATAEHLTERFVEYAAQRPAMLSDWAAGRDTDGAGAALPADLAWQAELWRRLRACLGVPGPAERWAGACAAIRSDPALLPLPERLSVFGATRLAGAHLQVFEAVAAHRELHLWLPHPSPASWTQRAAAASAAAAAEPIRRTADDSGLAVRHPLLAALGRDVRELQARLGPIVGRDEHLPAPDFPPTTLGRLQADLVADRAPAATDVRLDTDESVQVHACHGPERQVEVLRDCLLHVFAADPTLEPRDVLIMCPDIETYAPLIRAGFGQDELAHPAHHLRVRLADRALRRTNPLLDTVATLLDAAVGRVTAGQLLDLAASEPVRHRFGFTDEDLATLRDWAGAAGARWGIGQRQRAAFGLGDFAQNTVNTAVDRVLLGAAADDSDGWLGLALPLEDVESADIDLAGRFAEYVDRLAVTLRDLAGPQPARRWTDVLDRALDLLTAVPAADAWQLAQARRELAAATEHAADVELRHSDVRAMLARRLAGRPTRANFRTGELTVCTMVPMRSVPHRVVVLLGLDDDVFPRTPAIDGDDVLARNPLVGERDPRSEDRQLLLDAILAAQQRLLLFYSGADPVTGAVLPPAIPLREVLDVLGLEPIRHPLQPYDPRQFRAGAPFSFDRVARAGALASRQPPQPVPALVPTPLAAAPAADVELAELIRFTEHPTQAFLRQRVGTGLPDRSDEPADALSIDLDPLDKWELGDRMLTARLAGVSAGDFRSAEWRRGTLPPFQLGERMLDEIEHAVADLVAAESAHIGPPESVDVSVEPAPRRRLTGTVPGVHGTTLVRAVYSRLGPKHRIAAWVRLLALAATHPGPWRAVTTGRGRGRRGAWRSTLIAPADPSAVLRELIELRDLGLTEPLPLFTAASCIYAERRHGGDPVDVALQAAEAEWTSKYGESHDASVGYVHGAAPSLHRWVQLPPDPGYPTDEAGRFGALATTLWLPLLAAETMGRP